jgi:hypothetical protein
MQLVIPDTQENTVPTLTGNCSSEVAIDEWLSVANFFEIIHHLESNDCEST